MTNSNDMPLAAKPINRAAHRRTDEAWLEQAILREDALILLLKAGEPFVTAEGGLYWFGPEALRVSPGSPRLFLGEDKAGAPIFALDLPPKFDLAGSLIAGAGEFSDFRQAAAGMAAMDANCASTARSLFLWHQSHRYCAKCGGANGVVEAGWKAQCANCGAEHFPRTDPVAIMLAVKDDRALIGRQKFWPPGFMSCLAGFCEPGETIEQAAARELFEEAGILCDPSRAEYVACQPWPFPSSLMMGFILPADNEDITVDSKELESARWVTRAEMRDIIEGKHAELFCPPPTAIAHHIMKVWAFRSD
ncbi:NAD(+) diphosphatase [Hyphomonas sp. WL0036]|uniref:NAD(+) diphosphatase n=1 Tax=Hyphomonas sediminis TaxID=2866160 RepID=UPI001C805991|nr:NAD(+) diphosphatase [Hyphomonas sediminis]MBY9065375.1 NAD(+) diphosphatase [Hyphomonas sediminis]